MLENKIVEDFLTETKEAKVKQLLGIAVDIKYWEGILSEGNVEEFRKELSEQQQKVIKSAKGQVLKDERDLDKIKELSETIDIFEKAEAEIQKLKLLNKQIKNYLEFLISPSKETLEEMDVISNLI